jgi:sulfate adenylyltransferase large subunit
MSGLLRICTAGSVDDGKSTLIGRLLYDSRAVYDDQVHSVQRASRNRTAGPIDFSLFTDGLRAEREQGITIDVAYRYFATANRKFILADTPGHEQYTRNMATGASTADVAILLVDARNGVRTQTRRHARIAQLLGISDFALAVNKMDLVDFDRQVFDDIVDDFEEILPNAHIHALPLSALNGDNVITTSDRTPWFDGPSLLQYLEAVQVDHRIASKPLRFPVQLVIRPDQEFRGYAGQILSGSLHKGAAVSVWPSGRTARIKRIVTWDGDLDFAKAPTSVTLVLDEEIDVSRGDVITTAADEPSRLRSSEEPPSFGEARQSAVGAAAALSPQPFVGNRFSADVVWMDERPLDPTRPYLLKHTTRTVTAEVNRHLALNQIETVAVSTSRPVIFDRYRDIRATGSFILIDPATNFTAGAGMIIDMLREDQVVEHRPNVAERLAHIARSAGSHAEAVAAVQRALEDLLK